MIRYVQSFFVPPVFLFSIFGERFLLSLSVGFAFMKMPSIINKKRKKKDGCFAELSCIGLVIIRLVCVKFSSG